MSPRTKLGIANVLMGIGIVPLTVCVLWAAGILMWTPGQRPIVPLIPLADPIGMIAPAIASYFITLAIGGTSAAWSWDVSRANPGHRSRTALALRWVTAVVLVSPFALITLVRFLEP